MKSEFFKNNPAQKFEEITFPLVKIAVASHINLGGLARSKLSLDTWYKHYGEGLVAQLSTYLISNKVHEQTVMDYKHPKNWVQAFKEQYWKFIPKFLQRRFPIQYKWVPKKIDHIHICPHCDYAPWGEGTHITWMTTDDSEYHAPKEKQNPAS